MGSLYLIHQTHDESRDLYALACIDHERFCGNRHCVGERHGLEARGEQKNFFPLSSCPLPLVWFLCDFATNRLEECGIDSAGCRLQNFTALPVILFFVVARGLSLSC